MNIYEIVIGADRDLVSRGHVSLVWRLSGVSLGSAAAIEARAVRLIHPPMVDVAMPHTQMPQGQIQGQMPSGQVPQNRKPGNLGTTAPVTTNYLADCRHFMQVGELGHGTFGVVVKAIDLRERPPREVAIKLLSRGNFIKQYKTYVKREIDNQSRLRHPLIVSIQEVFLTKSHLAIVMEYARGGDLFNYTMRHGPHGRLIEQQARWIFQQLIIGLDYCHRRGVANRDLKLENLLLDHDGKDGIRPLLKICDFGYSKHDRSSSAKSGVGTPVYMAPEVILGDNHYNAKKADIWSCGVILYSMLFGKYPFNAKEPRLARRIVAAQYTLPANVAVSPDCLDMLTKVLVAEPAQRMGMEDIKCHPWFLEGLPPGALDMNEFLLKGMEPQASCQRKVELVVDQAQRMGNPQEGLWACRLLEPIGQSRPANGQPRKA
ncbi:hypothetical protein WJX73_006956 [Symbiochloris irregularis]|uniref:Protein kinase domain-containing protein n=1 Tax=Symbiochloris irregularis TaxID=706552 RepID=A0AAW1NQR9_9CHLO